MDDKRFDQLVKKFEIVTSRRGAAKGVIGGFLGGTWAALTGQDGEAQDFEAQECSPNGAKCGPFRRSRNRKRIIQRPCDRCCSRHSDATRNGRRCAAREDGMSCGNDGQCASGNCQDGVCVDDGFPS